MEFVITLVMINGHLLLTSELLLATVEIPVTLMSKRDSQIS